MRSARYSCVLRGSYSRNGGSAMANAPVAANTPGNTRSRNKQAGARARVTGPPFRRATPARRGRRTIERHRHQGEEAEVTPPAISQDVISGPPAGAASRAPAARARRAPLILAADLVHERGKDG